MENKNLNVTLKHLNEIVGSYDLTEHYLNELKTRSLTETDRFLIKLEVHEEIVENQLNLEDIESRITELLNKLFYEKQGINTPLKINEKKN